MFKPLFTVNCHLEKSNVVYSMTSYCYNQKTKLRLFSSMTIGYIHNYASINTISDNLYTYIFRSSAMHNIIVGLVFPNVEQKRNVVFMQSICGMLTITLTVLIDLLNHHFLDSYAIYFGQIHVVIKKQDQ